VWYDEESTGKPVGSHFFYNTVHRPQLEVASPLQPWWHIWHNWFSGVKRGARTLPSVDYQHVKPLELLLVQHKMWTNPTMSYGVKCLFSWWSSDEARRIWECNTGASYASAGRATGKADAGIACGFRSVHTFTLGLRCKDAARACPHTSRDVMCILPPFTSTVKGDRPRESRLNLYRWHQRRLCMKKSTFKCPLKYACHIMFNPPVTLGSIWPHSMFNPPVTFIFTDIFYPWPQQLKPPENY